MELALPASEWALAPGQLSLRQWRRSETQRLLRRYTPSMLGAHHSPHCAAVWTEVMRLRVARDRGAAAASRVRPDDVTAAAETHVHVVALMLRYLAEHGGALQARARAAPARRA